MPFTFQVAILMTGVRRLALGGCDGHQRRLRGHVRWAIEHGSSHEELEALVTLLAVYVGFPRASVAMEIVRDELAKLEPAGPATPPA